jgi:hypothetical protein
METKIMTAPVSFFLPFVEFKGLEIKCQKILTGFRLISCEYTSLSKASIKFI